ncbi:replication factor A3 [Cryptococcus wingfieldii CBS 7118]|uniref:Replication factor A3 n=1 Tax=Cryptococcus wingfieldii CBS 7118 TaxID=1295528 RepID=A0A1E3JCD4_9TREE|nr:replication factor A3 [Cryptococcus wingfieldii CBS 7118]ODN98533.1 replication factor A3 [Cryptococcus wingfieldii CBS 7118]
MARLGPEPRINSRYLNDHIGETVRLAAKVTGVSGDTATIQTSDGGTVGIHIPRDMHIQDEYVEIIGTVKEDSTVKAHTHIGLGKSLDMKAVNSVVDFSHSDIGSGVFH